MTRLEALRRHGWLTALDSELARTLGRIAGEQEPDVLLAAALASRQVREGHVCADLVALSSRPVLDLDGQPIRELVLPELDAWRTALRRSPLVSDEKADRPLVLDARGRLYLARYFQHERVLAERLEARARPVSGMPEGGSLGPALGALFGPKTVESAGQRAAAMIAALGHLTVITGGPGTGKTSTVVKLLALLARTGPHSRALLLAPTGKAAARLAETVEQARSALEPALASVLPNRASTIHRALGPVGGGIRFRHHRDNPLAADVVVVDESSMVDVALMRRLFDAVPESARLILLGDAHQLASVEAGAVLADICSGMAKGEWSEDLHQRARATFGESLPGPAARASTGLRDALVELTHSYRFSDSGGIGGVAAAVRRGDVDAACSLLSTPGSEAALVELSPDALPRALGRGVVEGYSSYLRAPTPSAALLALARFRVLAAHRRGGRGVEALNELAERALADAGLISPRGTRFYPGRPLMITENDYQLELYNGDVGVLWRNPAGAVRAYFPRAGSELREFAPSRLPPHETVFATSIHKSQGSEFDQVAIVLPEVGSPLLSRELVYTAITRARERALVYGSLASVRRALSQRAERASGLASALFD